MQSFRILALVIDFLLAFTGPSAAADSAAPGESAQIPNFWDLRANIERPSAAEIGPIRFLTTDDFPPFAFRDRRGVLIGFDIDLAEAICSVLKVSCQIQTRPFDTLGAGLSDGTGNAVIGGFDPERAGIAGLTRTQSYLKIPGRFVTAKGANFDPNERGHGGSIGVACGSAHQAFLARFFPNHPSTCFPTVAAALAELRAGHLGAVFSDALGLAFWLNGTDSGDCCRFAGGPYVDDEYFGAGLAIVVKAEDRKLKSALEYALREVYRSGVYGELYLRYFPIGLY
jgi:polar amino acid transport system substrate-binding protein